MTDMPETISVVKHPKSLPKHPQLRILSDSEVMMDQVYYHHSGTVVPKVQYEALQAKCDAYEEALKKSYSIARDRYERILPLDAMSAKKIMDIVAKTLTNAQKESE